MKTGMKYALSASIMALALVGCGNKDKPAEEKPTAKEQMEASTDLVVTERPVVACDDAGVKNRVVAKVQDELFAASMAALGDKGASLEQQLKARLAQTTIEIQDIRQDRNECQASLHIVMTPQDISYADRAFKAARLASLDEQAVERGISLLGGNRLVADFVYQADSESVAINSSNPAIALAGRSLAQAVVVMNKENRSSARQTPSQPRIVPAPNVTITPPPKPRPVPSEDPAPSRSRSTPTPESAILQSEDVPRQEQVQTQEQTQPEPSTQSSNDSAQTRSEAKPKAEAKPEPKAEPKAEPKPAAKAEPKPEVADTSSQITIVESDETY